jgi:deoxyribonuclease-2
VADGQRFSGACHRIDAQVARPAAPEMASHQEPQTYRCELADLPDNDPLHILAQPLARNQPPNHNVIDVKSIGGMPFKVIAKNREWGKDFWNELVGPALKENMDVETWIRGDIPPIADTDGIHKTFDIKFIYLGPLGVHWARPETHDHAKWGITKQSNWVCVGDINRMISQRKRGGGTIAFQNETLWTALSKTALLLAPPGYSRTGALRIIEDSQRRESEAPPKAKPTGEPEETEGPGSSQIDLVQNVLQRAAKPLHISDIIDRVEKVHGRRLDLESVLSALRKKVEVGDPFIRTGNNELAVREAR